MSSLASNDVHNKACDFRDKSASISEVNYDLEKFRKIPSTKTQIISNNHHTEINQSHNLNSTQESSLKNLIGPSYY